jgi:hypothetical protein
MDNYYFSTKLANEINKNNSLAVTEAKKMKESFEKQRNTKHSIQMSHIWGQSVITERMFDLVVKEYKKL